MSLFCFGLLLWVLFSVCFCFVLGGGWVGFSLLLFVGFVFFVTRISHTLSSSCLFWGCFFWGARGGRGGGARGAVEEVRWRGAVQGGGVGAVGGTREGGSGVLILFSWLGFFLNDVLFVSFLFVFVLLWDVCCFVSYCH